VRTVFDLRAMADAPETRLMILKKVWPETVQTDNSLTATSAIFAILLQVVTTDVHVRRIQTFWEVMTSLVVPPEKSSQLPPERKYEIVAAAQ
jgi:hypothetical protein